MLSSYMSTAHYIYTVALCILDGCFKKSSLISRKQYSAALPDFLSVDQVRYALSKFEAQGLIEREGIGKGTKYRKLKELI